MSGFLADLVITIHFIYISCVVLPVILIPLGWPRTWVRSRRLRFLHLGMIGFVVFEVLIGMRCPLTTLENQLLAGAGQTSYQNDFVARWIEKLMYWNLPPWFFVCLYTSFLGLVLLEWWIFPPLSRKT